MGRGRAKAKQTKVARELKYRPMDTDFSSLERELRGPSEYPSYQEPEKTPEPEAPDPYSELAARYGGADDDDDDDGYLAKSG